MHTAYSTDLASSDYTLCLSKAIDLAGEELDSREVHENRLSQFFSNIYEKGIMILFSKWQNVIEQYEAFLKEIGLRTTDGFL